ncbi:MAG: bifunctional phosphopantothenoylcysteine decarboxylase/phosphopantothenate--cysteine ligase CoaBC [Bacteroidota bacterium]
MLTGKHILLGVSGGIAAYKSPLIVRELVKMGAEVQVIMTPAATQFITPLTLGTLSRREVMVEMFPAGAGTAASRWTAHIDLALWADLMLIAPATADLLAKLTYGFADSFLAATVLALRCPLAVAPSMDVDMFHHPATQENLRILRARGVQILQPDTGELASGLSGEGRLPEPAAIAGWVDTLIAQDKGSFTGRTILVTAGPTQEPIDPVRYIGNRSSGKMGFAIAGAARTWGANVILVAGPVALATPPGVERVDVATAAEMEEAVVSRLPGVDALIMSAAVADFRPDEAHATKIKRETMEADGFTLHLTPNPDILKKAGALKKRQVLVGFALETEDGLDHARAKLASKNLDIIVLNNPLREGAGFGSDTNIVTLLFRDGTVKQLPRLSKTEVAGRIMEALLPLLP